MLTEEQYTQILEELDNCKKPLFFFHDDADGLASFLLLYRYKKEGKGICVKSHPRVDERFFKATREFEPDKIFIVDLAIVEQDFIDEFKKIPIVWIDHHTPLKRTGIKYFNPRLQNEHSNLCASHLCYHVVKKHRSKDIWIAAIGIIGDWQLTDVTEEFSEKYPDLLPAQIDKPEKALFDSPLSKIIKICNFILKGATQEVMKCVKILTRLETPYELVNGDTPQAKYILKRFENIEKMYAELLEYATKNISKSKLLVIKYTQNRMSFTGELSNELLYRYPGKVILVGRKKSGEMKCSLRTSPGLNLNEALQRALVGIEGTGGGHEYACGAVVKEKDFEEFIEHLKKEID